MPLDSKHLSNLLTSLDKVAFADTGLSNSKKNVENSIASAFIGSQGLIQQLNGAGVDRFCLVILYALGNISGIHTSRTTEQNAFTVKKELEHGILGNILDNTDVACGLLRTVDDSQKPKSNIGLLVRSLDFQSKANFAIYFEDPVLENLGYKTSVAVILGTSQKKSIAQLSVCADALTSEWSALASKLRSSLLGFRNDILVRELLDREYRSDWEIGVGRADSVIRAFEHTFGFTAPEQISPSNLEVDQGDEFSDQYDFGTFGNRYEPQLVKGLQDENLGEKFDISFGNKENGTLIDTDWDDEAFNFTCDERIRVLKKSRHYAGWFCDNIDDILNCLAKSFRLLNSAQRRDGIILVVPRTLYNQRISSIEQLKTVDGLEIISVRRVA